jgi:hypothetical protein
MKLTDFDQKVYAPQALAENYKLSFDVSKMSMPAIKDMLKKVRTLAMEAKGSPDFYKNQTSPAYMKLIFMEEALVKQYNDLASRPRTRIVFENEEVEKSQVVLAAQDMVDEVQKMVENVSDMMVKELPALVDSIQSEIGVNESEQFNAQVTEALTSLTATLTQSKTTLQAALNTITGQGMAAAAFGAAPDAGAEMGADLGAELGAADGAEMGAEMGADLDAEEADLEEPEAAPVGGVGRAKR